MKATILKKEHTTRKETLIEYISVDVNGKPKQVMDQKGVSVQTVILTIEFSEDDFKENYTFHVNVTDPNNKDYTADNLEGRIKERIQEELAIYKKRKENASLSHPEIAIKEGDVFEG